MPVAPSSTSSSPSFLSHPLIVSFNRFLLSIDRDYKLGEIDFLKNLSQKTGYAPIHCACGAALLAFMLIIQLLGLSFISNCFAFYPIYQSFKALKTPGRDDDAAALTYWIVYGSLSLVESAFDKVFFWLPLYFLAKIAFLVWCYHPNTNGAKVVYKLFIAPLFVGIQKEVEEIKGSVRAAKAAKDQ
jgi:receptor expression-enhancing protein 5/6